MGDIEDGVPVMEGKLMVNEDNWKHRSAKMRCDTCMWYVPKAGAEATQSPSIGRCRRHAPTMNGYPVVCMTDWCGDHKIHEERV